jgi:hypothetical protein
MHSREGECNGEGEGKGEGKEEGGEGEGEQGEGKGDVGIGWSWKKTSNRLWVSAPEYARYIGWYFCTHCHHAYYCTMC